MFKHIQVLIWDFDGTFYPPNPELWQAVREGEYRTIEHHTGWPREKISKEFAKLHKKVIPSATKVVAQLTKISVAQAAVEVENYFDRRKFLKRDEKLISLFGKLKKFRHFILANGSILRIRETLEFLGISPKIFSAIVTSETVGVTKPHTAGFRYILNHTKLPPAAHLMIGDREAVDLVPAKKLGIMTCLVWSTAGGHFCDVLLPTVYDIKNIV